MRSFNSGLWGFLLVTESHLILRAAVGRVQVDNQLEDYTLNRVIFAAEKGMGSKSSRLRSWFISYLFVCLFLFIVVCCRCGSNDRCSCGHQETLRKTADHIV